MKRVLVYVEGPSDEKALVTLLSNLLLQKSERGVQISFIGESFRGGKAGLVKNLPARAVNYLRHDLNLVVIALPDLYPYNSGGSHQNMNELRQLMLNVFIKDAELKNVKDPVYLSQRFKVYCLKHDLEVLLLAAKEELAAFLELKKTKTTFIEPVENQNNITPPVRIVENIFKEVGRTYKKTTHAEQILRKAKLDKLKIECQQCFKPFVEYLESL